MVEWIFFPKSTPAPDAGRQVVRAFEKAEPSIGSATMELSSNPALAAVRDSLVRAGFQVESGKRAAEKIHVPVLRSVLLRRT
jgi:hypothetical protein